MAAASPATAKPTSIRPTEGGTKPVALAAPEPAAPATLPAAQAMAAGSGVLQIGAYKSEADAGAAWITYKAKHATLLAAMTPDVKQVDLGAKGTWYRLRIIVSDKSSASALCDKLKSEGGACIPAK